MDTDETGWDEISIGRRIACLWVCLAHAKRRPYKYVRRLTGASNYMYMVDTASPQLHVMAYIWIQDIYIGMHGGSPPLSIFSPLPPQASLCLSARRRRKRRYSDTGNLYREFIEICISPSSIYDGRASSLSRLSLWYGSMILVRDIYSSATYRFE